MSSRWTGDVLHGFSEAAANYNDIAMLQRAVAHRLAGHCSRLKIAPGFWVDLGSGTGLLADALEANHPGQRVLRVDGSASMLKRHQRGTDTVCIDLSHGLPYWPTPPNLLASSFALHWLPSPAQRLNQWYGALAPKGWLALIVPVQGSFRQWNAAASDAQLPCSALPLPSPSDLLRPIPPTAIRRCSVLRFTQRSKHALQLLKPMMQVGAGTTPTPKQSISSLRKLFGCWPREGPCHQMALTWNILLLLLQR